MLPPARVRTLGRSLLVFVAVLATGLLATAAIPHWGGRALWMLPGGMAVAAIVRWGRVQCLAVFAAGLVVELLRGTAWLPALAVAAALPAGAAVMTVLLERYRFASAFETRRDALSFIGASLAGMAITAAIGASVMATYYPVDPADQLTWGAIDFVRWWLNNSAGVLLFVPFLISVNRATLREANRHRLAVAICLPFAVALAALVLFIPSPLASLGAARSPILAASTVLIVIMSLRLGFMPAAATAALLALTEASSYSFNLGAYHGASPIIGLVSLWSYIGAMIGLTIGLAILLAEQRESEARRRHAEAELRRNHDRLRKVLNGLTSFVGVFTRDGRLLDLNQASLDLVGLERHELVGMAVQDLPHFAYSAPVRQRARAALDSAARGELVRYDDAVQIAGNAQITVDLTFAPLRNEAGEVAQVVASAVDITERRALEKQVAAEFARAQQFLRNAGDGVHILDADGRVVEASDSFCEMLGYARAEVLGLHPSDLDVRRSRQQIEASLNSATVGTHERFETAYRRKDGESIEVEIRVNLFEIDGRRYFYRSARDLTELKRLERALIEAISSEQRRLGQEMHDGLGQELTGLSLGAKALAMRAQGLGLPLAADLDGLAGGMAHAIRTTRDIVRGLSPLGDVGGDLVMGLEAIATTNSTDATQIRVTADRAVADLLSEESRGHLYRIAQEATQNALKHAQARQVEISLAARDGNAELCVADDGHGIRVEASAGRGLGMQTMKFRARVVGGQLSIGTLPAGGTLVTCSIPRALLYPVVRGSRI